MKVSEENMERRNFPEVTPKIRSINKMEDSLLRKYLGLGYAVGNKIKP